MYAGEKIQVVRIYRPRIDAKLACLFHLVAGRFPTTGELQTMKGGLVPRNDDDEKAK